ncbi:Lipase 3 [Paramyrothecium foliicola]|nr:Lipase 3 [Paramyrothecium foliicola]
MLCSSPMNENDCELVGVGFHVSQIVLAYSAEFRGVGNMRDPEVTRRSLLNGCFPDLKRAGNAARHHSMLLPTCVLDQDLISRMLLRYPFGIEEQQPKTIEMRNFDVTTALFLSAFASIAAGEAASVRIGCSTYQGVQKVESGYASPPTQDLRWRPPVPLDPHHVAGGFVNATNPGPFCVQSFVPWLFTGNTSATESEDCLLLDIVTPINSKGNLPVLVNIHGGGYALGSAIPGESMVNHSKGSMIHVTVQYRLGAFGFLAGDEVASDGTPNAGLLDQRAALEWVHQYIHYFGGDPEKVTITGPSAGGASVIMQMIWNGGEPNPPFRAAIPEYPWMTPMYPTTWFNQQFNGLLSASECTNLTCLRYLPLTSLKRASRLATATAYQNREFAHGNFYWGPSVDGNHIKDYPLNELQNGHFSKVPILIDRSGFEGPLFTDARVQTEEDVALTLEALWQTTDRTFIDQVIDLYPTDHHNASILNNLRALPALLAAGGATSASDSYARLQDIIGDVLIDCHTSSIAKAVHNAGFSVYKCECYGFACVSSHIPSPANGGCRLASSSVVVLPTRPLM